MKGKSRKRGGNRPFGFLLAAGAAAAAGLAFYLWGAGAISAPSASDGAEMAFLREEPAGENPLPDGGEPVISIQNEAPSRKPAEESPGENETEETEETETAGETGQREICLAFAGDVLLSDHVLNAYRTGGGITGVVGESLLQEADSADLFMVNQEFPFSSRGTPAPDKQFTFRLPPEKVSLLQEMGIGLVTLANNHALDFGRDALLDTCAALEGAGIPYVGAGENLERAKALYRQQIGGWKVGFLGATRVIPVADWAATGSSPGMLSTYDPSVLLEEIRKAKEICDYLVVYVHWGKERESQPEEYQRQLGRQYLEAGADLVIGSHPHVLQGIEYDQGKPIVYSLGNFVFGSSIPRTVLLKAFWDGKETRLKVVPAVSSAGYTRELTDKAEARELFAYLESISFAIRIDENGNVMNERNE